MICERALNINKMELRVKKKTLLIRTFLEMSVPLTIWAFCEARQAST